MASTYHDSGRGGIHPAHTSVINSWGHGTLSRHAGLRNGTGRSERVAERRPWELRPHFRVGVPEKLPGKIMLVSFLSTHVLLLAVAF